MRTLTQPNATRLLLAATRVASMGMAIALTACIRRAQALRARSFFVTGRALRIPV